MNENINNQNNNTNEQTEEIRKRSKIIFKIYITICAISMLIGVIYTLYIIFKKDDVVRYDYSNIFIHNNMYYQLGKNESENTINLYVKEPGVDSSKKILCKNVGQGNIDKEAVQYINGEDLYFYTDSGFKKIDLSTCKIEKLNNYFKRRITKAINSKDNIIYGLDTDVEVITLKKIDIISNELMNSKTITKRTNFANILIDYKNFTIYTYDDYNNNQEDYYIKKDNKIIYDSPFKELLEVGNDYILITKKEDKNKYCIYKVNILDKSETSINCSDYLFTRIDSDNDERFFVSNSIIYKYNEAKEEIEMIAELPQKDIYVKEAYHYEDKIIFGGEKYNNSEYNRISKYIIVYNISSNIIEEPISVGMCNFDNQKFMYSTLNSYGSY